MPLPLDPDDDLQAAAYVAAGPQLLTCGHRIEKGETLVELTDGGHHWGSVCSVCYSTIGRRVAIDSGLLG